MKATTESVRVTCAVRNRWVAWDVIVTLKDVRFTSKYGIEEVEVWMRVRRHWLDHANGKHDDLKWILTAPSVHTQTKRTDGGIITQSMRSKLREHCIPIANKALNRENMMNARAGRATAIMRSSEEAIIRMREKVKEEHDQLLSKAYKDIEGMYPT